ncbi:MAG: ATP-dependent DNA helicase RecG [Mycobacteriaceae bacterium]|nr:ATP-dependent DNA helicase RecG [Mycobacteriaceae bacterium]
MDDRLESVLDAGPAKKLGEVFGIHAVEDLLRHYPHRYLTPGQPLGERAPADGTHVTVVGTVVSASLLQNRNGGKRLEVVLATDDQDVKATFFNGYKVQHNIKKGARMMMSGTVNWWPKDKPKNWSLSHPDYRTIGGDSDDLTERVRAGGALRGPVSVFDFPFVPVYPASAKMQSWDIAPAIKDVLDRLDPIADPIPAQVRAARGLIDLDTALRTIHFPETKDQVTAARDRLRFDEAAALALVMAVRKHEMADRAAEPCPPRTDGIAAAFDSRLPFELTAGQLEVAGDIAADLAQPHPMHRLLQGEVGSGKTIVALRAMLQAVDAGRQCALLAPTEVLAAQHFRSLRAMLGELGSGGELGAADPAARLVLVTGSMSVKAKREALLATVNGDAGIVIGTHALIQDNVEFFDLGLVVIDEQHRFGVEQRDALRAKARAGTTPHVLVMTATPIPRTIAMTLLGDLETSTLTELPRGRSPIESKVVPGKAYPKWVDRAWERIREEVDRGRQAYVVCSRIGDEPPKKGQEPETTAVVDLYEALGAGALAGLRVGLLHGRLPGDEKDTVMRAFAAGEIDVLVCTTVIEVGVDVPNATVMVIMDADRFGVSQLHQLRGRVGRGGHAGLCLMVTDANPAGQAMARLQEVADTSDGFQLALLDLRQRREGDILGAAQSGTTSTLRLLSLLDHLEVITEAQDFARAVVDADPALDRHPGLAAMMRAAIAEERLEYLAKG